MHEDGKGVFVRRANEVLWFVVVGWYYRKMSIDPSRARYSNSVSVDSISRSFLHSRPVLPSLACGVILVLSTDVTGQPWMRVSRLVLDQLELEGKFEKDLNNDLGDGESRSMPKGGQRRKGGEFGELKVSKNDGNLDLLG
jgi:hypothetical protein